MGDVALVAAQGRGELADGRLTPAEGEQQPVTHRVAQRLELLRRRERGDVVLVHGRKCSQILTLCQAYAFLNTMDETELADVVDQVRALVEANYIFPDVAAQVSRVLAAGLAERAVSGRLPALATAVTADLQSVNGDKHLRLKYHEEATPAARARRRHRGIRRHGALGRPDLRRCGLRAAPGGQCGLSRPAAGPVPCCPLRGES